MKSTARTSVRELTPGTFRVTGVRTRSAITGRFVKAANNNPRTTVTEGQKKSGRSSNK